MIRKPQVIDLNGVYPPWVRLLTHIQNSVPTASKCVLSNEAEAKRVYNGLYDVCARDPRFRLAVFRKRNEVYVVKLDTIQEIVIKGLK